MKLFFQSSICFLFLTHHSVAQAVASDLRPQLIGGHPVATSVLGGAVVWLNMGGEGAETCTGTLVGPKVLITAGHCGNAFDSGTFKVGTESYSFQVTVHPKFDDNFYYETWVDGIDYDIAVGIVDREVTGVTPIPVGGPAGVGQKLTMLGYGCTDTREDGGNDGTLNEGSNVIHTVVGTGMILQGQVNGSAGCAGDSGGPALAQAKDGTYSLVGLDCQGQYDNQGLRTDDTWYVRTAAPEILKFLNSVTVTKKVSICGINATCLSATH